MRASFDPATIAPTPLLSGDDLVARGHSPGPAFRHALDLAYDAQLENRISTRAEAITLAEAALLKSPS
jgi:poly(A) polymerase